MSYLLAFAMLVAVSPLAPAEKPHDESHCLVYVVGQEDDGEFVLSDPVCFGSEEEVDLLAQSSSPVRVLSRGSIVMASSTFDLGRHYDGFNGTGSSIRVVGASCTGGWWNTSSTWDNRISSSYNGCTRLKHWDYPNKAGSVQSTYGAGTTDNLSYMNNRAESVSYHSS